MRNDENSDGDAQYIRNGSSARVALCAQLVTVTVVVIGSKHYDLFTQCNSFHEIICCKARHIL
jgi:hypothetical protein